MEKLFFHAIVDGGARRVALTGRVAWTMLELAEAGDTGCTPVTHPAPRWSDYVFRLRKDGFAVETITEKHGGPFSGTHARYVLRDRVTLEGGNLHEWRPHGVRYGARKAVAA